MLGLFIGIVEDFAGDPLKIGRLKVRVQGVHSMSHADIATVDLPWATPMHPVQSAAFEGIGMGGPGVVIGTQCLVFFRDPGHYQQPVVIGTLPALFDGAAGSNIRPGKESDFGRLATNNLIEDTIIALKRDRVQHATGGPVEFDEPPSPYNTIYGYNATFQTQSGHVTEFDDTEDYERIHIWHKSGTNVEIHPDGTTVVRHEGDRYEISKRNVNVYCEKTKQEWIGEDQKEYVGGDFIINIVGDEDVLINGSSRVVIEGDSDVTIGGNSTVNIGGNASMNIGGNYDVVVGGMATLTVSGPYTVTAATINLNS